MKRKAAIVIGVQRIGTMTLLPAAIQSAEDFAIWARSQDIEVSLHIDSTQPVTANAIKESIKSLVDARNLSQLIIYFSGHGVLRSASDELWLLSGAPEDLAEAVNLTSTIALARYTGIPHIVFISDACRSKPENSQISAVIGQPIFPYTDPSDETPEVDIFYATIAGNPAYEVKRKDAEGNYKGLYTHCMLVGLRGDVPDLIQKHEDGFVIPSYELKQYLKKAVPEEASKVDLLLKQIPDAIITSRLPLYLSRIQMSGQNFTTQKFHELVRENDLDFTTIGRQAELKKEVFDRIREVDNEELNKSFELLKAARGRENLEMKTGFTIFGQEIIGVITQEPYISVFKENDCIQIRIENEVPIKTLVIVLKNGNGIPLGVLQGFIGTVVIQDGQVINVNYTPSRNNIDKYNLFLANDEEIMERRAIIATAARFGRFNLEGPIENLKNTAGYLRYMKGFDPTLGIYAAYAYAQAGENYGLSSIYRYMSEEREPVVFDVAMLAKLLVRRKDLDIDIRQSVPFCPMLTQGWSYLSIDMDILEPRVQRLSRYLVPGLWTTFSPKGVDAIFVEFGFTIEI